MCHVGPGLSGSPGGFFHCSNLTDLLLTGRVSIGRVRGYKLQDRLRITYSSIYYRYNVCFPFFGAPKAESQDSVWESYSRLVFKED